jgi:hypothetical protein
MARLTRVSRILLAVMVVSSFAAAQTTENSSAALERLNYFVGTWTLEVHMKISPFGSRAFFGMEHNEWMPGGFLLVSRQDGETAAASAGLAVMAYNTQEEVLHLSCCQGHGRGRGSEGKLRRGHLDVDELPGSGQAGAAIAAHCPGNFSHVVYPQVRDVSGRT